MKKVDYAVIAVFVLSLAIIAFFWGCQYDPMVTVLGAVIVIASGVVTYMQYKKLNELEDKKSSDWK